MSDEINVGVEENFEPMCAMTSGDRKRRLLECFESLAGLDKTGEHALTRTQKIVIAAAMEVRL